MSTEWRRFVCGVAESLGKNVPYYGRLYFPAIVDWVEDETRRVRFCFKSLLSQLRIGGGAPSRLQGRHPPNI